MKSEFVLSTGRNLNAYDGVIGIREDLTIYGGHDSMITEAFATRPDWLGEDDEWETLAVEEKLELANRMIALWTKYKQAVNASSA